MRPRNFSTRQSRSEEEGQAKELLKQYFSGYLSEHLLLNGSAWRVEEVRFIMNEKEKKRKIVQEIFLYLSIILTAQHSFAASSGLLVEFCHLCFFFSQNAVKNKKMACLASLSRRQTAPAQSPDRFAPL